MIHEVVMRLDLAMVINFYTQLFKIKSNHVKDLI